MAPPLLSPFNSVSVTVWRSKSPKKPLALVNDCLVTGPPSVILVSRIRDVLQEGYDIREAIMKSAEVRMRPVLMTSPAAAIASGIGGQSPQPLARVVVGGMLTSAALILFVLPVLYQLLHRLHGKSAPQGPAQ